MLVASSGSTAWVADDVQVACGANAASRSPRRFERVGGRRVGGSALLEHGGDGRIVLGLDVEPVRLGPDLAQERQAAIERAGRLELVAQHRASATA